MITSEDIQSFNLDIVYRSKSNKIHVGDNGNAFVVVSYAGDKPEYCDEYDKNDLGDNMAKRLAIKEADDLCKLIKL